MVSNLGVDLVKINVRPSTQKQLRRFALFELGNPNYAEHQVVFAAVAKVALYFKAPLVVWGEDIATEFGGNVSSSSQRDGSADDLINNDLFMGKDFSTFVNQRINEKELYFYKHPEIEEFTNQNVKSIYLGFYHWWDGFKNFEIASRYGFAPRSKGPLSGNIIDYDNIDEKLCELHIWFKFLKFGFWRPTDQACYQIWNGRMSRDEAVDLVLAKQYEFPSEYLPEFLEYHQISNTQFFLIAEKYRNLDIWHKVSGEWRLRNEIAKL